MIDEKKKVGRKDDQWIREGWEKAINIIKNYQWRELKVRLPIRITPSGE